MVDKAIKTGYMGKFLVYVGNSESSVTITGKGGVLRLEEKQKEPKKPKRTKLQISQRLSEVMLKFDESRIQKLKDGFAIGLNIKQACSYANISVSTYYNHTTDNPDLLELFEDSRQKLGIKAKHVRAKAIHAEDLPTAERYIAKEEPDVLKIEHGDDDFGLTTPKEDLDIIKQFHEKLTANRIKRSQQKAKSDGEL